MHATRCQTLIDALTERAQRAPHDWVMVLIDEDGTPHRIDAQALHDAAGLAAQALATSGVAPGDIILLAMRHSRSLIAMLCGAFYRGAHPSVLPYWTERTDLAHYAARVTAFVTEVGAQTVITVPEVVDTLRDRVSELGCRVLSDAELPLDGGQPLAPVHPGADDIAWLQFTSGTTGAQKAVAISHGAVSSFVDAYYAHLPLAPDDVLVSWLPLYHDMGLLTGLVQPLLKHIPIVLMSPTYWVRAPVRLMRAIHQFRGTICYMPNFGFAHCTRSIRESDMAGVDLSSLRRATCGGEPVRHHTLERFRARFAPYGLRESIFTTGYGMAENLMTACHMRGNRLRIDWIKLHELQTAGRAVPTAPESAGATAVVGNGPPLDGTEVRIVDEQGTLLPERRLGEILVRSPYMMTGYHRRPELSAAVLRDGWLHSGDLGYLADGELFICGRRKDLIIVGGHNVHAEEIEVLVESVDGVQPGRAVAFGVADERLGTEQAVVVCELQPDLGGDDARRIDRELRRLVSQRLGIALGDLRFAAKGWIVKTSSGKLARAACRDKYLATPAAAEAR